MAISFKGAHFPQEIILMGVRWYVAYPLSTRHVEELLEERGVEVDHATINRWVIKYSPLLEEAFHRRKRPVWISWRLDETYIKVKGEWRYLYRAVDKHGQTRDYSIFTGFWYGSRGDCSRATGFIQLGQDEVMQGFVAGLRLELHATYPAQDAR
jgi:putative transposase